MTLEEGKKAPDFKLNDKDENEYSLSKLKANYFVIYFYPKDNTPRCTLEAKDFSDKIAEFRKRKTEVYGISGQDEKSKEKFCNKYGLKITLLADKDFTVSKKYGVYGKKSFMGMKFNGIFRTTFVLDKNKKVIKVFEKVKPFGHAKEVLEFIKLQ